MDHDAGVAYTTNLRGAGGLNVNPNNNTNDGANNDPMAGLMGGSAGGGGQPADLIAGAYGNDITDAVLPLFKQFITSFRIENEYVYARMLRENLLARLGFLEVNVEHLQQFSEALSQAVQHAPTRALPRLEAAAVEVAVDLKLFEPLSRREMQIQLFWPINPVSIRQLAHEEVARLVCVSGIVIKASATHARCVRAVIQCSDCKTKTSIPGSRSAIDLPPQCLESQRSQAAGGKKCRPNPYMLLPSECTYEDQQVLKLQELPDDVPTGELPRHVTVIVDRYLVDKVVPGGRVQIAGIVSVQEKKGGAGEKGGSRASRATAGLRAQYLRSVGIMLMASRGSGEAYLVSVNENFSSRVRSRSASSWQAEDEAHFKKFAREYNVYNVMSENIHPAIFGLKDQKKAVACLLFGGTRKKQETNFLRGDMNVLFIGDPSTAKSQLLKFTEKIAPIGIYTSGKGSSAAGLTASVVGSGGGDFWLEAGSMVLADGGVVCIDEFDKMREQDQVAIHEAMEQQTISIAKANLTTMLNSRTSVLAAANPTMGSYDPLRSNDEQMDFAGSILSRFDLIFKVLDPKDPTIDRRLAQHVVALHKSGGAAQHAGSSAAAAARGRTDTNQNTTHPLSFLTKYIAYARSTCRPVISEEAMAVLLDFFVQVRRDSHALTVAAMSSAKGQAPMIQITPRQLESLVRITESMAKMRLDPIASVQDAEEAIRLFKTATVDTINSGITDNAMSEDQAEAVQKVEEAIRRRVATGSTVMHSRLAAELSRLGFDGRLVDRALYIMMKREEVEWRKQRTLIYRAR